jgi:hypothetical protein
MRSGGMVKFPGSTRQKQSQSLRPTRVRSSFESRRKLAGRGILTSCHRLVQHSKIGWSGSGSGHSRRRQPSPPVHALPLLTQKLT